MRVLTRKDAVSLLIDTPTKYGKMLGFDRLGFLHNGWIQEMVRGRTDYTLQASRETYKTTSVSIALAIIMMLLPNKRLLFMRKTDSDVKEVIKQVQKILQDPHTQYIVQCIYGVNMRLVKQSATEVTTSLVNDIKGTDQLVGMGLGSSLTGKHFDYIFTDDIVNINDRISKAERDRTKLIYQELQNVKNRGGKIFNSGTPWHEDDCFSIMPEPVKFDCYHPEIQKIISPEYLEDLRSKMMPSLFAANYELRHVASEDVIFQSPNTGGDPTMCEQGTSHVDAAYGGEDFTAFTICRKVDGKYYVLGKLWRKHVDDVSDAILNLHTNFNCGKIYCEDNGDKGYLAKALRKKGAKAVTYHENTNKYLKITTYLKDEWNNIIFVAGTDDAYIKQILDYNENAEHDDAPDSLASLVRQMWRKSTSDKTYQPIW